MAGHLSAPAPFRRLGLALALALAAAQLGLLAALWRSPASLEPGSDPHTVPLFVVLGTAFTLQAMTVMGIAWTFVALSRTELTWDDRVRLEHPWREWSGDWSDLRRVWWRNGWLALEIAGQWRRWYVRVPDASVAELQALRAALPAGVWLDGAELRAYYFGRVLPVLLGAIGIGGLLLVATLSYLRSL